MKNSIKTKNKLFVLHKKNPTSDNFLKYKTYRNKLNGLLRKSERDYYEELFNNRQTDIRKKWNIIKNIINKKKTSSKTEYINLNGNKITDKSKIANTFNNYFVNIGPNLAKDIISNGNPEKFLPEPNPNTIFLHPVVNDEVQKIINDLKSSSPGWDKISGKVIKATYQSFIQPLTHVINLSFSQGVFPTEMKIAKVLPFFKNGDLYNVSNYRPISVLPFFSKFFERLIYNRMSSFIVKHNVLYSLQFGFREGHSTGMA